MKFGFDIFRQLEDGSPIWIANVATRAQAEQEVTALQRSAPAGYFIRDAETGEVVSYLEPGPSGKNNPAG
jgi:hypothetical protein